MYLRGVAWKGGGKGGGKEGINDERWRGNVGFRCTEGKREGRERRREGI